MSVLNGTPNPAHHCQLVETLMSLKPNILLNIMSVIAYGTKKARLAAVKILFYYWPPFDHNLFDRKSLLSRLAGKLINFFPIIF